MSTRARILATIGAAWAVVLVVASIVLAGHTTTETYYPGTATPGQIRSAETREVYPWGTWWAVAAIATVIAGAAVGVALAWTRRHD